MSVPQTITTFLPQLYSQYLNQGKEPYVEDQSIGYYVPGAKARYDELTKVVGLLWRSFEAYDRDGLCKDRETFYKDLEYLPLILTSLETASNDRVPFTESVSQTAKGVLGYLSPQRKRKKTQEVSSPERGSVKETRTASELIGQFRSAVSRRFEALPSQNGECPAPAELSNYFSATEKKVSTDYSAIRAVMRTHRAALSELEKAKDIKVSTSVKERKVARNYEAYGALGIKVALVGALYLISRGLSRRSS